MMRCFLVTENGTVTEGVSFGHVGAVSGEIVFTAAMSGYQESITDPAYRGRILVSAFPLAGNYGVNSEYDQSDRIQAAGLAVREYCREPSDMYGGRTLDEYMKECKVPGISGIDTRDLVKLIRSKGVMNASIVYNEDDIPSVKKELKKKRDAVNLIPYVSSREIKRIGNGKRTSVGIIDCGAVRSMISDLSETYDVVVFPYDVKAKDVIDSGVKAVIVSSGPGDPNHPDIMRTVVNTVKELSGVMPVAGVALGAQAIALAFGCKVTKMKFGHHGAGQPVKCGDRVYITAQNHLYTINEGSMKGTGLVIDQTNVNDGTPEGFTHSSLPIFGIQYYPASPKHGEGSYFCEKLEKVIREAVK